MKHPDRIFTEAEVRCLLRAVRERARRGTLLDRVDHALVCFAWATGCRASEIASMSLDRNQPNHVDLSGNVVLGNGGGTIVGGVSLGGNLCNGSLTCP